MGTGIEPVALYIHLPFCEGKCSYCGFYSVPVGGWDTRRYTEAVCIELDGCLANGQNIKTVYIGGGTPTILPQADLAYLLEKIADKLQSEAEYTIETNPNTVNLQDWRLLKSYGINRVSLGVQSFDDGELKMLGRRYRADEISRYLDVLANAEIYNISLDLIFALPGSTLSSWLRTLKRAIALPVQHISAYSLSYDEGTAYRKLLEEGEIIPLEQEIERQMYERTIELLENAAFLQYEISNFAKAGFECRHNLTYWQNQQYIGVGASAGSFYNGVRSENFADIGKYIDAVENGYSAKEYAHKIEGRALACETAVLMLRTKQGIIPELFTRQTQTDVWEQFAQEINENVNKGMLKIEPDGRLTLTKTATPIADTVMADFAK